VNTVRLRLRIFWIALLFVWIGGSLAFMAIERIPLWDALYFTLVTIATVGYGDIHPITHTGKLLAVVLIIMGVGAFLGVVANATELLLKKRERQMRLEKLNMVIGVFFTEIGTRLLVIFSTADPEIDRIRNSLVVESKWTRHDFARLKTVLSGHHFNIEIDKIDLPDLWMHLREKRETLVRLLENPMLHEHESFTDLLQALFHLTEELAYRGRFDNLPQTDLEHLANDIKRGYKMLLAEWVDYMAHLKANYPYLFSLAMRTNPFDTNASPIVK